MDWEGFSLVHDASSRINLEHMLELMWGRLMSSHLLYQKTKTIDSFIRFISHIARPYVSCLFKHQLSSVSDGGRRYPAQVREGPQGPGSNKALVHWCS